MSKYFPIGFKEGDIWLTLNKTPIKWNIPFGVIVDSLVKDRLDLPLLITAHFRNFPESFLVKYKTKDSFRFYYLNNIKEACTLKNGSAKEVFNLSTKDTNKLIDYVMNPNKVNFNYYEIEKKILEGDENILNRRFPVKFIFDKTDVVLTKPFIIDDEDLIYLSFKYFVLGNFEKQTAEMILSKDLSTVIVNGTEIDFNTPMLFLLANFTYLDMFLYIIINEKSK